MFTFIARIARLIRPSQPVPEPYRKIFSYLYLDIGWFGILNGSTIAFLSVYATRMGASPQQIGLLSAVPALVNLLFALPVGGWLSRRSMGSAVFWTSVVQRSFYLLLVPLPILLMPGAQVWVIILSTLIMSIPGTAVGVGFNSMFGELVPLEWRGHVVGLRNAIIALVSTLFTLLSGWILDWVTFPYGYQIVFAMGVIGAAMSSFYIFKLSRFVSHTTAISSKTEDTQLPGSRKGPEEFRAFYSQGLRNLRLDVMSGRFARIMGLLFNWHLFQYMTIPIITPFIVNELRISNQWIGFANGLFNVTMFLGSLQLNRVTARFGSKRITGGGIIGLSCFPLLAALGPVGYMFSNVVGGFAWAMGGGALYNYLLENIPDHDRPAYMAWYTMISNAAILIGSILGPAFAGQFGYIPALLIFGFGRMVAGVAILLWG